MLDQALGQLQPPFCSFKNLRYQQICRRYSSSGRTARTHTHKIWGDVSCDMYCHILIVCLEGVHTYTYASLLLWPSFCKRNCYAIRPSSARKTVLLAINAPSFFKRGASQTMHFLDAPSSLSFCLGFDCLLPPCLSKGQPGVFTPRLMGAQAVFSLFLLWQRNSISLCLSLPSFLPSSLLLVYASSLSLPCK